MSFIDGHLAEHGIEPICTERLAYYEHQARHKDPMLKPTRVQQDRALSKKSGESAKRTSRHRGSKGVTLAQPGEHIGRQCTVERLIRTMRLRGIVRGKTCRTTVADSSVSCPMDLVQRQFSATLPNQLWVAHFTYVATRPGLVYVSFVIDVFSRGIVGWREAHTMRTDILLDAMEQTLWSRQDTDGLVHHSDRGSQYLSIRYSERLAVAGWRHSSDVGVIHPTMLWRKQQLDYIKRR